MTAVHAIVASSWFIPLVTTILILAIVPLFIGYMSLVERKVLADLQARYGPMRVGPRGLLQPPADALKHAVGVKDEKMRLGEREIFVHYGSWPTR